VLKIDIRINWTLTSVAFSWPIMDKRDVTYRKPEMHNIIIMPTLPE